jgi:hypothetical protein
MTAFEVINFVVSAIVWIAIFGIVIVAFLFGDTTGKILIQRDNGRYSLSNTGWTLTLWAGWWLTLFILYLFIGKHENFAFVAVLSALGDLSTLGAVIALCRGGRFRVRELIPLTFIVALVVVWCLVVSTLQKTPQAMLIAIGPSAVLSATSAIALGWGVIVRCGWGASPFGLLTLIYAFVQPAAYVSAFVLKHDDLQSVKGSYFAHIDYVFWFLALGKIIIAITFLGYYFSDDHSLDKLREEKYLPSGVDVVHMHPSFAKVLKVGGASAGSIAIGLITAALNPKVVDIIKSWFEWVTRT